MKLTCYWVWCLSVRWMGGCRVVIFWSGSASQPPCLGEVIFSWNQVPVPWFLCIPGYMPLPCTISDIYFSLFLAKLHFQNQGGGRIRCGVGLWRCTYRHFCRPSCVPSVSQLEIYSFLRYRFFGRSCRGLCKRPQFLWVLPLLVVEVVLSSLMLLWQPGVPLDLVIWTGLLFSCSLVVWRVWVFLVQLLRVSSWRKFS